ncbi:hypothetical protein JX266_010406 [Neoarthrinium moseri]|nr:hypothetical protein JX266_010406 [Neoarthrinium moseri]
MRCEYPPARRPAPEVAPVLPEAEASATPAAVPNNSCSSAAASLFIEDIGFDYSLLDLPSDDLFLDEATPGFQWPGQGSLSASSPPLLRGSSGGSAAADSPSPWFLQPSTWVIEHTTPSAAGEQPESSLHAYIASVRSWLFAWVSEPSNPLIHPQLYCAVYQGGMPRCVQDAYTAVTTYKYRTAASTPEALRILDARAEQLVADQALDETLAAAAGDHSSGEGGLTVAAHLARVHALLAYQALRLFDGDVRARARADGDVDTLFRWSAQMHAAAGRSFRDGSLLASLAAPPDPGRGARSFPSSASSSSPSSGPGGAFGGQTHTTRTLWHAFILLESVRRAFLTAEILQHTYLMLKRGWSDCPGGVPVTLRRGLWDAGSAYAWSRLALDGGVRSPLFMQSMSSDRLFAEAAPEDVDEFGIVLLGIHFDDDRIERWIDEKRGEDGRAWLGYTAPGPEENEQAL